MRLWVDFEDMEKWMCIELKHCKAPLEALQISAETSVDGRCLNKDHDSSEVMITKRGKQELAEGRKA